MKIQLNYILALPEMESAPGILKPAQHCLDIFLTDLRHPPERGWETFPHQEPFGYL